MTRPMMIRSIALSEDSFNAWKAAGGWFPRRDRTPQSCLQLMRDNGRAEEAIINLGDSTFAPSDEDLEYYGIDPDNLFNHGDNIYPLIRPGDTRKILDELMPPRPTENELPMDVWLKPPGRAGRGKRKVRIDELQQVPREWDIQKHVTGTEYRVITVEHKVVQVNERQGENGNRSYNWVGVTNAPSNIKSIAKRAARVLQGRNIIGWDVIVDQHNKAYILEGNSCPGVNYATADRVIRAATGRTYDAE
jgi:hypothetical protein